MTIEASELEKKTNRQQTRNNRGFKDYISSLRLWACPLTVKQMLLAASLIYKQVGSVDWPLFLLMSITVLFSRLSSHLTNTYYDYIKGVDEPGSDDTCLVEGHLTTKDILWMNAVSIGGSVLGIAMVVAVSPAHAEHVLAVYIILGFMALNYSGGLGLKYIALGECVSLSAHTGTFVATYVWQGVTLSWIPVLYILPTATISIGAMLSNNIRDMVNDAKAGITTLPILIGKRWAGVL